MAEPFPTRMHSPWETGRPHRAERQRRENAHGRADHQRGQIPDDRLALDRGRLAIVSEALGLSGRSPGRRAGRGCGPWHYMRMPAIPITSDRTCSSGIRSK
jgi:hypothetical protein